MNADAELCVIGAGEAGYTAAMAGVALGLQVAVVSSAAADPGRLNWDVALAVLRDAGQRAQLGLSGPPSAPVDSFRDALRAALAAAAPDRRLARLAAMNIRVLRGRARFIDPQTVDVAGQTLRARRFILATGVIPDGAARKELPALERLLRPGLLPPHIQIGGGDPRSAALAQGLRRLGVGVTLHVGKGLLPEDDPELVEPLRRSLQADGVVISVEGASGLPFYQTETTPCLADLELGRAGVAVSDGDLVLSPSLRTTSPRVFAVGGVAGGFSSQAAQAQVASVIKSAFFRVPTRYDPTRVPVVTVSDPEIATIGLTEAASRQTGPVTVLRWPFAETSRGVSDQARGLVKVVANKQGRVLGAGIVGPNAADQIGFWSLALRSGATLQHLAEVSLPSPSFSEASRRLVVLHAAGRLRSPWIRRTLKLLGRFS